MLRPPPGFMYAPRRPGHASRRSRLRLRASAPAPGDGDDDACEVYGCYAAVALADCRALQALRGALGSLLSDRQVQRGAYALTVVPALLGDACHSAAWALDEDADDVLAGDLAEGGGSSGGGVSSSAQVGRVDAEDTYLVAGPRRRGAAELFASCVLKHTQELQRNSPHLVLGLELCQGVARAGSNGNGSGRSNSVGSAGQGRDGGGGSSHGLVQLLSDEGSREVAGLLADAAGAAQGGHVAVLRLLVAVTEGLYVLMDKRLVFQHAGVQSPLAAPGAAEAAHRSGGAAMAAAMSHGAGDAEPAWDADVYQRVFLSAAGAQAWEAWNGGKGDPAQPYHVRALVAGAQARLRQLEAEGRLLDAQRVVLLAAVATQDAGGLAAGSRALRSAAQELRCMQQLGGALRALIAPDAPAEQAGKIDTERVRRLLLMYCSRVRQALSSHKHCYFSGFAEAGPRLAQRLQERLLGRFRLEEEDSAILDQLDLWTHCCEYSVSASIHDCLDPRLRQGLMQGMLGPDTSCDEGVGRD